MYICVYHLPLSSISSSTCYKYFFTCLPLDCCTVVTQMYKHFSTFYNPLLTTVTAKPSLSLFTAVTFTGAVGHDLFTIQGAVMTKEGTYNNANLNITLRGHHGYSSSTILEKCQDVIFLTPSLSNRTVSIIYTGHIVLCSPTTTW